MVHVGYLLFAPLGLMAALVAPSPLETATGISMFTMIIATPVAIILYGNLVVAAGLGITGGLALSANLLASRF
jgi:branched-subunit amino acid transport protein